MSTRKQWLWLSALSGISALRQGAVLAHFGSVQQAYAAQKTDYTALFGNDIPKGLLNKDLEQAERILEFCQQKNIAIITIEDSLYPAPLKQIFDPPLVLYARGRLLEFGFSIGIVGTRSATGYGILAADTFGRELASHGATIVSGMAEGIDGAAHRAALQAGGKTIAVLGCSVDYCYPSSHQRLMDDIVATGLILSEYPPTTTPQKGYFPQRNRIISGLCQGILVPEAPERSGALITARLALDQGRDVFAVPGSIDGRNSVGCHKLLKEGCFLAASPSDVMERYTDFFGFASANKEQSIEKKPKEKPMAGKIYDKSLSIEKPIEAVQGEPPPQTTLEKIIFKAKNDPLSPVQLAILEAMTNGSGSPDELISATGMGAPQIMPALTMLEIRQVIKRENGRFVPENPL